MTFLSSTDEQTIREEWMNLRDPDFIDVELKASWRTGMLLPDDDGSDVVRARFGAMMLSDYQMADLVCSSTVDEQGSSESDYNAFRVVMLRMKLKSWNISVPLEHNERGWLTEDCTRRVIRMPGPLVTGLLDAYESSFAFTDDEEKQIDKQSAILFSNTSSGVSNACEAIGLFCNLTNFWDKFGLNYEDLKTLPYKKFLMLRVMLSKDMEASAAEMRRTKSSSSHASPKTSLRGRNVGQPIVRPLV